MALTDHYMLWSYVFVFMAFSTALTTYLHTALYIYRTSWLPMITSSSSFSSDLEAGLHSDTFSLTANIDDEDSRSGLDVAAKREVLAIMKRRGVDFDEARRIAVEQKLARNGIAPDGRPLDPRAVFFS
ncbi:hypothetical protein BZA05DRAFT_417330 [Tricharina praecox]|uniref:uncharacterized protein n=1 Tax=Tricharina praecox TaxID=43433 RepID=UPI00221F22AB|nr:uncharacterized protein BZA05DRAFT_417330 [Tricharina praecox]KAI5854835.1 hypothetical protein BZA05DRAFT_417330 [Tricharina praecox]